MFQPGAYPPTLFGTAVCLAVSLQKKKTACCEALGINVTYSENVCGSARKILSHNRFLVLASGIL